VKSTKRIVVPVCTAPTKVKKKQKWRKNQAFITSSKECHKRAITVRANLLTSSVVQMVKNLKSTQLDQCNHEFVDQMCHDGVAQFTLRRLLLVKCQWNGGHPLDKQILYLELLESKLQDDPNSKITNHNRMRASAQYLPAVILDSLVPHFGWTVH
jgi:hypothetical protein